MIQTSTEYKEYVQNARKFYCGATITLADTTVLAITDDDIMMNGMKFTEAISADNKLNIGHCITNKLTLTLDNSDHAYDSYDFDYAVVRPYVSLQLSSSIEQLYKGYYTIVDSTKISNTVYLTCFDYMSKLDVPFSNVGINPVTWAEDGLRVGDLLQDICDYCGLALNNSIYFTNANIVLAAPIPTNIVSSVSCRDVVSYIAQLSGCFGKINNDGELYLDWYTDEFVSKYFGVGFDGGSFDLSTPYATGDTLDGGTFNGDAIPYADGDNYDAGSFADEFHIFDEFKAIDIATYEIQVNDVIVKTYTQDTGDGVIVQSSDGTGYVFKIANNPLIRTVENANDILDGLATKLVGNTMRPMKFTTISNPAVEAGDMAIVNQDGNSYICFITSMEFSMYEDMSINCDVESAVENAETQYTLMDKISGESDAVISKMVSDSNELTTNSLGGYRSDEVDPTNGGIIHYMHDKPLRADSTIIWRFDSLGFMVSSDGGANYEAGFDAFGNAKFNVLSVVGLNADWIVAGSIESQNYVVNTSGTKISLTDGSIDTTGFKVNSSGVLTATSGTIGGYTISSTQLYSGSGGTMSGLNKYVSGSSVAFWAGAANTSLSTAAFQVDYGGNVKILSDGGYLGDSTFSITDKNATTTWTKIYARGIHSETSSVNYTASSITTSAAYMYAQFGSGNYSRMGSDGITTSSDVTVFGDLNVYGTKNRVVKTENYGDVLHYCYETTSPYFGDIGESIIEADGQVDIDIDDIFQETIDMNQSYQVFTSKYSDGEITSIERLKGHFIVKGTAGLSFAWEVKAKQIDYPTQRMKEAIKPIIDVEEECVNDI